jgi:hypothetical protein
MQSAVVVKTRTRKEGGYRLCKATNKPQNINTRMLDTNNRHNNEMEILRHQITIIELLWETKPVSYSGKQQ